MRCLCLWALIACLAIAPAAASPQTVSMKLVNKAGAPVELFWVSLFTPGELVKQTTTPVRNGSDTNINTYDTHEFQVKWLPGKGPSEDFAQFAHGKHDSVVTVFVNSNGTLRVEYKDRLNEVYENIDDAIKVCMETQRQEVLEGNSSAFVECVANGVVQGFDHLHTRLEDLNRFHTKVANTMRNYTCADPNITTSESVSNKTYFWKGQSMNVSVFLDTPHAKIMLIDNFLSDQECNVLMDHGRPKLHRATVASADGTSIVSHSRKAQQASYDANVLDPKDPLHDLKQRVFNFATRETGFQFNIAGQEGFTIIQYNPTDQYMPHCDGSCDSSEYNSGGRVATMVMYCHTAEKGGGTAFSKADIFVNPKKGQATFFSYLGPDGKMDAGYTEHSGCPIIEGEKWITTQWMRLGVDANTPWDLFDPSGARV